MNKKVQKTKKSILVASVLSLFAFSLLGMGISTSNPYELYAETETPATQPSLGIYTSISDNYNVEVGDYTTPEHSGLVAFITNSTEYVEVTYWAHFDGDFHINGLQFDIIVPTGFSIDDNDSVDINSDIAPFSTFTDVENKETSEPYTFTFAGVDNDKIYGELSDETELFTIRYTVDPTKIIAGVAGTFDINANTAIATYTDTDSLETVVILKDITVTLYEDYQDEYVKRADISIEMADDQSKTYDAEEITVEPYGTTGADLTYTVKKGTTDITANTDDYGEVTIYFKLSTDSDDYYDSAPPCDAGTYSIKVTIENGYLYSSAEKIVTFTINQAPLTLTPHAKIVSGTATPLTNDTVSFTITTGDNQWKDATPFSASTYTNLTYLAVSTDYTSSTPVGENYASVTWKDAKSAIVTAYSNYNITFAEGTFDVTIGDFDLANVVITNYNAVYDGQTHNLSAQVKIENFDASVATISFTKSSTTKTTFKNVADSGNYTVIVELKNSNLSFKQTGSSWTINGNTATLTNGLTITVTTATLIGGTLDYSEAGKVKGGEITQGTDGTTTFNLSESGDTLSYRKPTTGQGYYSYTPANGFSADAEKTWEIIVVGNNFKDYKYTTKNAYKVTFYGNEAQDTTHANTGTYNTSISGGAPTNMPSYIYRFEGQNLAENKQPRLSKHYSFEKWIDVNGTEITTITATTNAFACWKIEDSIIVSFVYTVDGGETEYSAGDDITVYADDASTNIIFPEIDYTTWFANSGDTYYKEKACQTKVKNTWESISAAANGETTLTIYGFQNFAIGFGDINGSEVIDADDLSIYRQFIVGGYGIKAVEKNNEWATSTATDPEFVQDSTKDFLKRVADVNVQTGNIIGDNKYDIRDVCTIAMAIAGGYGLLIINNDYANPEIAVGATFDKEYLQDFIDTYANTVEEIIFTSTETIPEDAITYGLETDDPDCDLILGWTTDYKKLYITNRTGGEIFAPADCSDLFSPCWNCENLTKIDLTALNTSQVTNMECMFSSCYYVTELDVRNFNTSNVTTMSCMFAYCYSLKSLNLSNFDTSNVTDMFMMFGSDDGTMNLESLNVSSFDTSNVTNMAEMFENCYKIQHLDLSSFNTSNVTDMCAMFNGCSALTEIDLSNFNTSNVIYMNSMFNSCSALTEIDLSMLNLSKVERMSYMFNGCSSIEVIDFSMYYDLNALQHTQYMFAGCSQLVTIYSEEQTFNPYYFNNSTDMFKDCISIVGGDGTTTYDANHIDGEYAIPDGYGVPCYLTYKPCPNTILNTIL